MPAIRAVPLEPKVLILKVTRRYNVLAALRSSARKAYSTLKANWEWNGRIWIKIGQRTVTGREVTVAKSKKLMQTNLDGFYRLIQEAAGDFSARNPMTKASAKTVTVRYHDSKEGRQYSVAAGYR